MSEVIIALERLVNAVAAAREAEDNWERIQGDMGISRAELDAVADANEDAQSVLINRENAAREVIDRYNARSHGGLATLIDAQAAIHAACCTGSCVDLCIALKAATLEFARYQRALELIDRCVVGGCEGDFGSVEPCDSCVEMRTYAENALRAG